VALEQTVEALAAAGLLEQAKATARTITRPGQKTRALVVIAGALASAGHYQQAEATARTITILRADALAQVAYGLARTPGAEEAGRMAAVCCVEGPWDAAAGPAMILDSSAFAALANRLARTSSIQMSGG
jgi:hypothetical protein